MDSQSALAQLQQIQSQSQDPNTILSNQRQQLGVDNAQQTVTGLRGAINNTTKLLQQVAPSVMGRTGNSLVTNAQAQRQIQNEQAPISQNLSQQTSDYNQSQQDLDKLQQQAQLAASGIYQGQQDKLSYAQNLYNTLYQKEQDAAAAAKAEADRQEQIREFNAQLASKQGDSSGSSTFSLPGAGSSGSAQMQQRADKGYNFQGAGGNAINAVAYSQAKNVPIRTLLQQMASSGDVGAKTALDYVGNDYGVNIPKLKNLEVAPATYNKTISLLRSLGFKI